MAETAKWYVVHTYSGYENKVAANIEKVVENRGLQEILPEVRVPTETVIETREDGKQREVERKLFPGYVLVKMIMNDDSWYIVRNTRGVTGFVGPASKPVPLTDAEVEALGVEAKRNEVNYSVGETVTVVSGPLEGYIGTVKKIDEAAGKVNISVSMFGRETLAELELNQVKVLG